MAITGSTDLGDSTCLFTVDADPTSTAVDAPAGSIIVYSGTLYWKTDNGLSTNFQVLGLTNTAAARTILDDATVAAMVTTLGLADVTGYGKAFFSVRLSGGQSFSADTNTKIQFVTVDEDPNSDFDEVTNHRYLPTIAGRYFIYLNCSFGAVADRKELEVAIFKNGSAVLSSASMVTSSTAGATVLTAVACNVIDMNGSTDYLEGFAIITEARTTGTAGNSRPRFCGFRIGPD